MSAGCATRGAPADAARILGLVWWGGMAVLMWLFIIADWPAGVAAVAGTAVVVEAVKLIRRRRRGERAGRLEL